MEVKHPHGDGFAKRGVAGVGRVERQAGVDRPVSGVLDEVGGGQRILAIEKPERTGALIGQNGDGADSRWHDEGGRCEFHGAIVAVDVGTPSSIKRRFASSACSWVINFAFTMS